MRSLSQNCEPTVDLGSVLHLNNGSVFDGQNGIYLMKIEEFRNLENLESRNYYIIED